MRISDWSSDVCSSDLDVRTLATYKDAGGWLDGKPAIVTRKVGRGSITYVGAWLEPDAMAKLAASLLADAKVGPIAADAHPDFEIVEHACTVKRVLCAINQRDVAHHHHLPAGPTPAGAHG